MWDISATLREHLGERDTRVLGLGLEASIGTSAHGINHDLSKYMSRSASERELHSFVMSVSQLDPSPPVTSVSELDLPSPAMFDESAGTFQQRTPKYRGHPDYVPPMTRRQNRKRRTRRQKKKCRKNQHQTDEGQKNEHVVPAEHEAPETNPTDINRDDRDFEALYALEHLPFFDNGPAEGQIIEYSEKTELCLCTS